MHALFLALVAVVGISLPMKPSRCTFHCIFYWISDFILHRSTITSVVAAKLMYVLHSKEMKR